MMQEPEECSWTLLTEQIDIRFARFQQFSIHMLGRKTPQNDGKDQSTSEVANRQLMAKIRQSLANHVKKGYSQLV